MDYSTVQPTSRDPSLSADAEPLMEFGEVELRPLEKQNEPSRDRAQTTQIVGAASPADLPIYVDMAACEQIETHAREDTDNEVGGVLLGKQYEGRNGPFVHIVRVLPAQHVEHSGTHLKFTHDTWETFSREKERLAPELDIVGWYHTHPGLTVFMSSYDRFIHDNFFNRPQDVALVVDPLANDRGFFHWDNSNGRKLRRCTGFYLTAPRRERVALQQWAQTLQMRPLAPHMAVGAFTEKEIEDMSRLTLKDLSLAVLVLIVVVQSLLMWNASYQRTMVSEMFAALPFTEDDWIRKNRSLQQEKQELIVKRNDLSKQLKDLEKQSQDLEQNNKDFRDEINKLKKAQEALKGDVKRLKTRNDQLTQEVERLGGKVPSGFFARRVPLPVVVGGAILLTAIVALTAVVWMTRKHQQEMQKSAAPKPEA